MAYIEGSDRRQAAIFCLEDFIATDAPVRVIDAFCNQIDYVALDFRGKFSCDDGRPNYHPSILLRLYIYGYLNGIRSSRRLERECKRNVEVMWLCSNLLPKYLEAPVKLTTVRRFKLTISRRSKLTTFRRSKLTT
jgi:transposase